VLGNHCSAFIDNPRARTGMLEGNPLHTDMLAAARLAKLQYIVNVVIDEEKRTVAPCGGYGAGAQGRLRVFAAILRVQAAPADVVVTTNGGAPLDQNIYQCVKGLTAAEATANPGAVLILCAECADGTGGDAFYRSLRDCLSPHALYEEIMATPQQNTIRINGVAGACPDIKKAPGDTRFPPEMRETVQDMKMEFAPELTDALKMANAKPDGSNVTVIPNGISVIVEAAEQ
jgi:nickel-dependent lactate racemase